MSEAEASVSYAVKSSDSAVLTTITIQYQPRSSDVPPYLTAGYCASRVIEALQLALMRPVSLKPSE